MLVEIAVALVNTASIIITSAIILSFLVDILRASLSYQTKNVRIMTYIPFQFVIITNKIMKIGYLRTIMPGKIKARDSAVVDPRNWKKYQISGIAMAAR